METFFLEQMSEWIAHSKDLFVQSLTEVGQSHQHALDLQTQHQHFTANCMVSFAYYYSSGDFTIILNEDRSLTGQPCV